jgi:hypothetical protein
MSGSLTITDSTFHLSAHVNFHIDGTGLSSGASYSSNATGYAGENVELDNMNIGEATIIVNTLIIGQGTASTADVVAHITVTPNGNVTAFFTDLHMTCN